MLVCFWSSKKCTLTKTEHQTLDTAMWLGCCSRKPKFVLTCSIPLTVMDFRFQLAFFRLPKSRKIWWAVNIFLSKQMFGPLAGGQDVVPGMGPGIHRATRGSFHIPHPVDLDQL